MENSAAMDACLPSSPVIPTQDTIVIIITIVIAIITSTRNTDRQELTDANVSGAYHVDVVRTVTD